MSFYTLDKNDQVYGDYIKRLREVLRTYQGEYEVTLAISTLQSLLTVLTESKLYKRKNTFDSFSYAEGKEKKEILNKVVSNKKVLGLSGELIIKNTYCHKITIKELLSYIRHSLSHPVACKKSTSIPKTGFYTVQNEVIEKIVFTNSPDSDSYKLNFKTFDKKKEELGFPKEATIIDRAVYVSDEKYHRYIQIEFTPKQLKQLVLDLCDMFSKFIMHAENPKDTLQMLANKFAA